MFNTLFFGREKEFINHMLSKCHDSNLSVNETVTTASLSCYSGFVSIQKSRAAVNIRLWSWLSYLLLFLL